MHSHESSACGSGDTFLIEPEDQVEASQHKWPPLTGDYDVLHVVSRMWKPFARPISRAHLGIALDRIDAHRSVRPEIQCLIVNRRVSWILAFMGVRAA
jgi:hypothetical protein